MSRLVSAAFSVVLVAGAVACGGNVENPVASTGPGSTAGTGGSSTAGTGGSLATGGVGGAAVLGGSGGTGGSTSKGGSGGTGGSSSKGGSGGTGGSTSKGGSGGSGGDGGSVSTGGSGGTTTASCEATKPLPDECECEPQGPAGFYWDGSVCTELFACCAQVANGKLYPTQGACKADHIGCDSCGATVIGPDPCDCDPGKKVYYWDGKVCAPALVCCPSAAGKLYDSAESCNTAHASCGVASTCETDADCPPPPCLPCAEGGASCPQSKCSAGACVALPGPTCVSPSCSPACSNGCAFPDKKCGTSSSSASSCLPMPKCAGTYDPVCGCDGNVHQNACLAMTVGVDTSVLGNCVAPSGHFACGDHFCARGKQYCERLASDVGGFADGFACKPLPEACNSPGGGGGPCSCFEQEPCGSLCTLDAEGYVTLTCPGG